MRKASAFSPAGISSFFQICDTDPNGKAITEPEKIGARGGGFGLKKGVLTEATVTEAKKSNATILINGKPAPQAQTTRLVVDTLLEMADRPCTVEIRHKVEVPIGAGFGASAGGALTTGLALSAALDLNLTLRELGRIAHVAEVKCKTGLGTVTGILYGGGCVLVLEPGAPNFGSLDSIPVPRDYYIVAGVFEPRLTSEFLSSTKNRETINKTGKKTLERILAEPSLENFLGSCRQFAETTGSATKRVTKLMDAAEKAGAIGAAQNMLGEAVHALAEKDKVNSVLGAFERLLPRDKIVVAEVSLSGAQLM